MTKTTCIKSKYTEREFQRDILDAFEYDPNVFMWRRNVGAVRTERSNGKKGFIRFAEAGQSDIWGIIKEHRCPFCNRLRTGTHFEIEVKSDKGKLTPAQCEWIGMVKKSNGIAIVVYPDAYDPIGLQERIYEMLTNQKCPECIAKSKF